MRMLRDRSVSLIWLPLSISEKSTIWRLRGAPRECSMQPMTNEQISQANAIAKPFGADFAEFDGIFGTDAIGADKAMKLVAALSAVGIAARTVRSPLALSLYVEMV